MNLTGVDHLKDTADGNINFPFKTYAKEHIIRNIWLFNDDYADGIKPAHMSSGTVVDDPLALNGKALKMPSGYGISHTPIVPGKDYIIRMRVRHDQYDGFRYFNIGPNVTERAAWPRDYFGMLLANPSSDAYWNRKVYLPYNTGPIRTNPGGYVTMKVELIYEGGTTWTVKQYYQDELVSTKTKSFGTIYLTWYAYGSDRTFIDTFSIEEIPK
jgi:hypothetical protein